MVICVNCGCVRENASVNCSICGSKSVILQKCLSVGTDYKQFEVNDESINHPKHYTSHPSGIEVIQITEHMNFCLGNAIKYILRHEHKGGIEDLKKAIWYINREITKLERMIS